MAKTYKISIVGATTALMNRLDKELNEEQGQVPKDKRNEWQDNNWRKKLYTRVIDEKEVVAWPEMNVKSLLVSACSKYKVSPPKSIGRSWIYYFKSSVIITDPAILSYNKIEPFGTMVNGNPSSSKKSSKVYSVRPMIYDWKTTIFMMDIEEYLNKEIVKGILEYAGKFVGLSDWHPDYGRFKVLSVEVI